MSTVKGVARNACGTADNRNLSFAVELKFLVPFVPQSRAGSGARRSPPLEVVEFVESPSHVTREDTARLWRRAFSGIARAISTVPGQDALTTHDLEEHGLRERDCWAAYWIVKKSNSAEPDRDDPLYKDHLWVPVEVTSPKMSWKDPSALSSIEAVIDAIRSRYHIVSNYSCEVHVHVGRIDGRAFSLGTLRKLAMLLWLAEPVLRRVKNPKSPNFNHTYTWSFPAREHSRLAMSLQAGAFVGVTPPQHHASLGYLRTTGSALGGQNLAALGLIASTRSHIQLGRLMSGEGRQYRRLGFNFSAFGREDQRSWSSPRTVECRFLEGTIDSEVVLSWVQIYVRAVEVASDQPGNDGNFTCVIERLMREEEELLHEEQFASLMKLLGVSSGVSQPIQAMVRDNHGRSRT